MPPFLTGPRMSGVAMQTRLGRPGRRAGGLRQIGVERRPAGRGPAGVRRGRCAAHASSVPAAVACPPSTRTGEPRSGRPVAASKTSTRVCSAAGAGTGQRKPWQPSVTLPAGDVAARLAGCDDVAEPAVHLDGHAPPLLGAGRIEQPAANLRPRAGLDRTLHAARAPQRGGGQPGEDGAGGGVVEAVERRAGAAPGQRDRDAQGVARGVRERRARQQPPVAAQLEGRSGAALPRLGEPLGGGPDEHLQGAGPAPRPVSRQRHEVPAPGRVEVGRQLRDAGAPAGRGLARSRELLPRRGELLPALGQGPARGLELLPGRGELLPGRGELLPALGQGPARGLELLAGGGEPLVALGQRVPGGLELLPGLRQPLVLLVEPPVPFPEGLPGGLQRVGHVDQLARQDAALPARLLAGRQRAAESRRRRIEGRADAVQLAGVGPVRLAPGPPREDAEAVPDPGRDAGIRQQPVVAAAMMAQVGREERVDVRLRRGAVAPRQRQAEVPADAAERRGPVRQQIVVAHVGARQVARVGLGVEDVAQPDEVRHERVDPVAGLERGGDVERAADGRDDARPGVEPGQRVGPERQQAADARVLEDEQPALAVLRAQHLQGPLAQQGRRRATRAQLRSKRPPVVPSRSRRTRGSRRSAPPRAATPRSRPRCPAWPPPASAGGRSRPGSARA